jgi:hypothetical protein
MAKMLPEVEKALQKLDEHEIHSPGPAKYKNGLGYYKDLALRAFWRGFIFALVAVSSATRPAAHAPGSCIVGHAPACPLPARCICTRSAQLVRRAHRQPERRRRKTRTTPAEFSTLQSLEQRAELGYRRMQRSIARLFFVGAYVSYPSVNLC